MSMSTSKQLMAVLVYAVVVTMILLFVLLYLLPQSEGLIDDQREQIDSLSRERNELILERDRLQEELEECIQEDMYFYDPDSPGEYELPPETLETNI